jgi:site-specific recombinase XerC
MTDTTSHSPATTLRERFVEGMNLHRLSRATQRNYVRDLTRFAAWLGRPPDRATGEDLRRYQIDQHETGLGAPAMNAAVSALRFFYTRTLDRPDLKNPGCPAIIASAPSRMAMNQLTLSFASSFSRRPIATARPDQPLFAQLRLAANCPVLAILAGAG